MRNPVSAGFFSFLMVEREVDHEAIASKLAPTNEITRCGVPEVVGASLLAINA
jgi:hypothetical protein